MDASQELKDGQAGLIIMLALEQENTCSELDALASEAAQARRLLRLKHHLEA